MMMIVRLLSISSAMALLSLLDDEAVTRHMPRFLVKIKDHHVSTMAALRQMGAVIPGNVFWEREDQRYLDIFPQHSTLLAPIREMLQNSSDAKTTELVINCHDIQGRRFVSFADTGRWCPAEEERTYEVCAEFFLFMNGSAKPGSDQDGGFGVGRFIILFSAPLWFFTTRHLLVMGEYGTFQVCCRRCFATVTGPSCHACHLRESETPPGTVFYVAYKAIQSMQPSRYFHLLVDHFLQYAQVPFPITVGGKPVALAESQKVIHQNRWFTVHALKEPSWCSHYIVRTASGVPMYSHALFGSERGHFVIDLVPEVNYRHFDQNRRALISEPGTELSLFFESRQGVVSASADLRQDVLHHVKGFDVVRFCAEKHHIAVEASEAERKTDSGVVIFGGSGSTLAAVKSDDKHGAVECRYLFRNGRLWETLPTRWLPDATTDVHLQLMLMWVHCLQLVIGGEPFEIGFVFDADCQAMKKGTCYYINPELAVTNAGEVLTGQKLPMRMVMYLWSLAVHEASHRQSARHDESFASAMTTAMFESAIDDYDVNYLRKLPTQVLHQAQRIARNFTKRKSEVPSRSSKRRKKVE